MKISEWEGIEAPAGDAFRRAWLESPRPLCSLRGLKAHADPPGVPQLPPQFYFESRRI